MRTFLPLTCLSYAGRNGRVLLALRLVVCAHADLLKAFSTGLTSRLEALSRSLDSIYLFLLLTLQQQLSMMDKIQHVQLHNMCQPLMGKILQHLVLQLPEQQQPQTFEVPKVWDCFAGFLQTV